MPSDLTNALVDERLDEADAADGFILDGYPRSVDQAEALTSMLAARNTELDAVLEFRVCEEELLERLKDRGRADDTEEVIRNRMKVYRDETAPLLEYYGDAAEDRRRGRLAGRGLRPRAARAWPVTPP